MNLFEKLATLEHERWAKWQKYMHSKCIRGVDGSLKIPVELVDRWKRQIDTPYADLSEKEKESDREQIRPFVDLVRIAFMDALH